jgi:hypothetical protein
VERKLTCQHAEIVNEKGWATELAYVAYLHITDPALGFGDIFATISSKHVRRAVGWREYNCTDCLRSHAQVNQINVMKMFADKRQDIEVQKARESPETGTNLSIRRQGLQCNRSRMMAFVVFEYTRKDDMPGAFRNITGNEPEAILYKSKQPG